MNHISRFFLFGAGAFLCALGNIHAGTATTITGLYYTGVDNAGGLLNSGNQDSHWAVTTNEGSAYQGQAYVVRGSTVTGSGWSANTANARWITPPGATNATGGNVNQGYNYLPGNGTTGTNAASYAYTLAFTITGTGTGVVSNQVTVTLTLAADDNASVYINPTMSNGLVDTASSTLGGTVLAAWGNTRTITLQNFDNGANANNATFVIGINYLTIQVDNTNGITGTSAATALNASGLMVYQTGGSANIISPNPTPEVGVWLPVVGALGLFFWRRRNAFEKPISIA